MAIENSTDENNAVGGNQQIQPNPLISVADLSDRCFPTRRIPQNERTSLELNGIERAKNSPGSTQIQNDVRGIIGEYVVADLFGAEVNTEIYQGGDGGYDFCVDGMLVDVKTRNPRCNNPDLLVDANENLRADYYVLAQELSSCTYRVIGYASARTVQNARIMEISPESPASRVVKSNKVRVVGQHELRPITEMMF